MSKKKETDGKRRTVELKKSDLLKMEVKSIQDLRLSDKLSNISDISIEDVDRLILAKLPSSNTLGPFITELLYYGETSLLNKESIIKKLDNALSNIIIYNKKYQHPDLMDTINNIKQKWIRGVLKDVFESHCEVSKESIMVVSAHSTGEAE